jgi:mannose/fructose-specific phosphotransferase system component IIA
LLLTDFWGGSCHTCGASAARRHGEVIIVTGVNLPLLLDYLYNRDKLAVGALAERLQQKGRDSIRVQRGVPA